MREAEQASLAVSEPKSLETARLLARRDTEKQAFAQLVEHRRAALRAEREKQETVLRPRLDEISQGIYEIGRRLDSLPLNETQIHESISNLHRSLVDLSSQVALAGDELKGLAQDLGQKLEETRKRLDQIHRQSQLLDEITGAVAYSPAGPRNVVGQLARGLQKCIQADPTSARSRSFQDVLKEQPLWQALDAWNQLAAEWKAVPEGLTPSEAKSRAALCAQFLNQHPACPNADAVAADQRFAEAIARRTPGVENSPPARLQRLFSDILVDNVWMVTVTNRDPDGRISTIKYYTTSRPVEKNAFVQFMSLISFNGKEQFRLIAGDRIASRNLSPQSKIAADFKPILADESKLARWETVMRDLVARILDEPDIDPILQVALLRRVLDSAVEASEPLKEALGAMKTRLDQANVDINVPWMNPETANIDRSRTVAADAIQRLRTVAMLPPAERILDLRDRIEHSALQTYPTVGWLARDGDKWQVRTGGTVPNQGELWVVLPLDQKTGRMKKLGRIDGGKPTIDARDSSTLAEGRPVFLVRETR
jgi:hypothetical protein